MKDLNEKLIEKQKEALKKISNPVGWMQNDAEKRGLRFDGMWAIKIAENPNWLREIATNCLSEIAALEKQIKEQESKEIQYGKRLGAGRDFLVIQDPKYLTVEDCLEAFGFTRDGLNELIQ